MCFVCTRQLSILLLLGSQTPLRQLTFGLTLRHPDGLKVLLGEQTGLEHSIAHFLSDIAHQVRGSGELRTVANWLGARHTEPQTLSTLQHASKHTS